MADPTSSVTSVHTRHDPEQAENSPVRFLLVTFCIALAAGLAEALILLVRREALHQFIWVGTDVVWMAPISYAVFFLPIGIVFALVAWRVPRYASLRGLTFVCLLLTVAALLDVAFGGRIHLIARAVLAFGLAYQGARWLSGTGRLSAVRLRRLTIALVAIVASLGIGLEASRRVLERRGLAALPTAAPGSPNVILLILDTVRAASMGLYDPAIATTPELDAFAQRGVIFDRAIVTAPWTLPSHTSMFTGRLPPEVSADWFTPLDGKYPTLAEVLQARGYATAGFLANYLYTTPETGLNRGFLRFDSYSRTWRQLLLSSAPGQFFEQLTSGVKVNERKNDRKSAEQINREFLSWVGAHGERPFFAVLNYFDAHKPYYAVSPFAERFGSGGRHRYEAAIAYLDHQIGELLRTMEQGDLLRETIVIVTSDHGELFGESGGSAHGGRPIYRVLHVPLLVVGPGAPAGRRVSEPVSLRDLPATVLNLVESGESRKFPGAPLSRFWQTEQSEPELPVLSAVRTETQVRTEGAKAPFTYSLVGDTLHFIRFPDGREQLFDYRQDPEESNDLASQRRNDDLQRFRTLLDSVLKSMSAVK
jgi:arylsulfatase A-like enzyme